MDLQTLLALEPEELGAHVLLGLRAITGEGIGGKLFHFVNHYRQVTNSILTTESDAWRRSDVVEAVNEAWSWLEAQGLLVPATGSEGPQGWRLLSRRARRFNAPSDFVPYRVARMMERDMLNPRIREEVWAAFIRGHFQTAANVAMQEIEIATREACGWGSELTGQTLLAKAFDPERGPLTDTEAPTSEQKGVRDLFIGAFAAHRNPGAHRRVTLDDAAEVIEIVLLANHLLRIIDRAIWRQRAAGTSCA